MPMPNTVQEHQTVRILPEDRFMGFTGPELNLILQALVDSGNQRGFAWYIRCARLAQEIEDYRSKKQ